MKAMKISGLIPLLLIASLTTLSACSSSDDDSDQANAGNDTGNNADNDGNSVENDETISYAYAFTRTFNYSAGQIERISITDGYVLDATYPGGGSDYKLATDGNGLFQIGTFQLDSLTRFDAVDTSVVYYQVSVLNGASSTTNPQSLAFVNDDLAYLTRREIDTLLIVDPTPEQPTAESLITGEISLGAYNIGTADAPDYPDMTDAVIVDNKLFVLLEYIDGFTPINRSYLAVIDLASNLEIDTGRGESPLKGIQLNTVNATALHYNESTGLLYVTGRGNYFGAATEGVNRYTGGVESIDPVTYQTSLLVDDGDESENVGFFNTAVVVNDDLGYLMTLEGFRADGSSISNLRTFNPSTGVVSDPVAGTEGTSLTLLTLAPDNHLWVGIQADVSGFMRIDLDTGIVADDIVATQQIPSDVVFIEVDRQ